MNRKEAIRIYHQEQTLQGLGFTLEEARALRRISMTLRRWFELECGTDSGAIQQNEKGEWHWYDSNGRKSYQRIPDRETGARKRLARIIESRNARAIGVHPNAISKDALLLRETLAPHKCVSSYIQTDPRGAALYILRPGDVPEGADVSAYYSRGICVY